MRTFSTASFNLYQYAEPGTFWYEAETGNAYRPDQWLEKQAFIADTLADLDADIVGFQEVFSTDSFRQLLAASGYAHVALLEAPPMTQGPGGETVFLGPVCALASRFPILSARILPARPELEPETLLAEAFTYRRGVIEAEIAVPGLAHPLVVYVCHFKSQGAFVDKDAVAALPDWRDRFRFHMAERARLDANQVIRRAGEAMMLHATAMDRVAANPDQGIAVLGDLNDEPDSFTLRILTQNERLFTVGGRSLRHLEVQDRAHRFGWQLYSTAALAGSQAPGLVPTHVGWMGGSVLDYILVSNALNRNNPEAVAHTVAYDVFNDHQGAAADRLTTSDHAPIRARFAPLPPS